MIRKPPKTTTQIFLLGIVCGTLGSALPSYCINQYAWDNLNRSKDLLLKQLDHVTQTKKDLIERREAALAEFNKRIDALSEYEEQLNNSLREVEDAMK